MHSLALVANSHCDCCFLREKLSALVPARVDLLSLERGTEGTLVEALGYYDAVMLHLERFEAARFTKLIRKSAHVMPVIVLIDHMTPRLAVEVLDEGADQCLTAPYHIAVVAASVRAIFRRADRYQRKHERIQYQGLVLDVSLKSVTVHERSIPFTASEFRLLEALMTLDGRVGEKATLNSVLGDDGNRDAYRGTLTVLIKRIREKLVPLLGHDPIKTVYGRGYAFGQRT